jgi:hypothetical protein
VRGEAVGEPLSTSYYIGLAGVGPAGERAAFLWAWERVCLDCYNALDTPVLSVILLGL